MPWTTPETFTAGQTLTAASMNAMTANDAVLRSGYLAQQRLAIQTTTTFVNTNSSLSGSNEVFTDLTYTADGTSTYRVEVFIPYIATATNAGANVQVHITNGGTTSVSFLGYVGVGDGTRGAINPVYGVYFDTPTAGTRTLNVKGVHGTATGNIGASTGEGMTAFIAVYGPVLT